MIAAVYARKSTDQHITDEGRDEWRVALGLPILPGARRIRYEEIAGISPGTTPGHNDPRGQDNPPLKSLKRWWTILDLNQ